MGQASDWELWLPPPAPFRTVPEKGAWVTKKGWAATNTCGDIERTLLQYRVVALTICHLRKQKQFLPLMRTEIMWT